MISEIETKLTEEKLKQTLLYATTLWLQSNKPVYVLVITPDRRARSFAKPVTLAAGSLTVTLVLCLCGPDQIPVIADAAQVAADPAMAALSVMAHGERKEVGEAFLAGLKSLDEDDATRYYEYANNMASVPTRRLLEALMAKSTWPVYSTLGRKHFGEGEAKGRAEGEARAILVLLEMRGITLSDELRTRLDACADEAQLDAWLRRAAVATSAEEVFA